MNDYTLTAEEHAATNIKLWDHLRVLVDNYCGRFRQPVVGTVLVYESQFREWPASISKHQNHKGGLLVHTLQVADHIIDLLPSYKGLNREMVVAAALVHDIGKIYEYTWSSGQATRTEMGTKVGHISIGHSMVTAVMDRAVDLTPEDKMGMEHCILSHHGRQEWGSPVEPKTREAWLLHLCDMISSRVGGNPDRPMSEVRR